MTRVRAQLLKRLDTAWLAFKESYDGLTERQLLEPGVTGQWSVRDIIAHVTTWEEEALKHLPSILQGRTPPRYSVIYGGIDAFNALMTAKKAALTLGDVFREQDATHRRVIAVVVRAPEEQLAGGTRFRRRLRFDTYRHYPIHARAIRRWRQQRDAAARARRASG